jgi:hypothetical protein
VILGPRKKKSRTPHHPRLLSPIFPPGESERWIRIFDSLSLCSPSSSVTGKDEEEKKNIVELFC